MGQITEKEEEITKYCEDFCPIYQALLNYNISHKHIICCGTDMCKKVEEAYILNFREESESALAEKGGAE